MLVAFRVTFVVVFPKNTWRREEEVGKKKKKEKKKQTGRQTTSANKEFLSLSVFAKWLFFPP